MLSIYIIIVCHTYLKIPEQSDNSRSSARLKAADTKRVTAIVGLSSEEKKKQFLNRKSKDIGKEDMHIHIRTIIYTICLIKTIE